MTSTLAPRRLPTRILAGLFAFLLLFGVLCALIGSNPLILQASPDPTTIPDNRLRLLLSTQNVRGFDAYVLGSFPAHGYSATSLSKQLGLRAYNLACLDNDPSQTLSIFRFVTKHFEPKVILLSISPCDLVSGSLSGSFQKFTYRTGGVSHELRDIERIGHPVDYREAHQTDFSSPMPQSTTFSPDRILELAKAMTDECAAKGVRLITVLSPVYKEAFTDELQNAYVQLKKGLQDIGAYYDFSESTLSGDARFFYNTAEFRSSLGDMVLARIFKDNSLYTPDPFGVLVSADGQATALRSERTDVTQSTETAVPILLYHNIADADGSTPETVLEEHLQALTEAGYQAISLEQLENYVYYGTPLPEKPICITFDDGYESNYSIAFPLLKKYDMPAAIFYIGWSVGKDTYKETGLPIYTHFTFDQARQMRDSGLITLGSHTYDMHQSEEYEPDGSARPSVAPLESEHEDRFTAALKNDLRLFSKQYQSAFGAPVKYFSYPHGVYSPLSERILADAGIRITLSTDYEGRNVLVCGLPQTLRAMYRCTVPDTASGQEVLDMLTRLYGL